MISLPANPAFLFLAALYLFVSSSELAASPESSPEFDSATVLPEEFSQLWQPWTGDLSGMIERRAIRVVVPFGGYQFYYEKGKPRGAIVDLLRHFETFLNEELQRRHIRVYVVPIPVSRDKLFPALLKTCSRC